MRFETPGRWAGSYVMLGWESVRATLIFFWMEAGESVRMIRDFSSAWDLDILDVGSLRDITRFAGAGTMLVGHVLLLG